MKTKIKQPNLNTLALLARQWLSLLCLLPVLACQGQTRSSDLNSQKTEQENKKAKNMNTDQSASLPRTEVHVSEGRAVATFANGCFWCTEAVFQDLKGVESVASGYSGGFIKNPAYREVCNGTTGHAEALQIVYDPKVVSFEKLLEVFWKTHDPTTLNRQGNDVGTQYRSGVFYHNQDQKRLAEEYKAKLDKSGAWDNPVVTEITPFTNFYKAEDYHQNYFKLNGEAPYCQFVVRPKVEKFRKAFATDLK